MALNIKGLDHLVLSVKDINRALSFYIDILGCVEERRVDNIGLVQLRAGAQLIDLIPVPERAQKGVVDQAVAEIRNLDHFCLCIDPFDETEIRNYLTEQGVEVGETATRYGAQGLGPSIYIKDSEGNVIELKG